MNKFISTIVILLVTTLLMSCSSRSATSVYGKWKLHEYADIAGSSLELTKLGHDERCTLTLHDTGVFSFTTDCNTVSGEYSVNRTELNFRNMACTEMACDKENIERAIRSLLPMVDSFECHSDSTLILWDARGNVLLSLGRY